jgi:CysZ protein
MQSYFYGFSMLDYTSERLKMNLQQSENFIWQHKWLAVAIGTVFNLLVVVSTTFSIFPSVFVSFFVKAFLLIPLIALSIAPIYGVVAGTIAALKILTPPIEH